MVKKFIAAVFVVLALVVFSGVGSATSAHASSTSASVSIVKAAPTFVGTQVSTVSAVPKVIGGGVIKPLWRYVSCYLGIDGYTYCWRYACTTTEYWLQGCRDGWYRIPKVWYV